MTATNLPDVPEVYETERLTLRCPRPGDGVKIHAAVRESLAELLPWMHWAKDNASVETTESNMLAARDEFFERKVLRYLVFLRGTETLVGSSGLHNINWEVPSFETGYWVRTCFAGKGYITETVNGLTELAFTRLGARRMQIICASTNVRSVAVARRAGYQLEGVLRNVSRHHLTGELYDEMMFSRVKTDRKE